MKFKSEKIKIVAPDGILYSKMLSEVEIYREDGTVFKLKDVIADVVKLQEDLIRKEIELREGYTDQIQKLQLRIAKLEKIQAEDDSLILE